MLFSILGFSRQASREGGDISWENANGKMHKWNARLIPISSNNAPGISPRDRAGVSPGYW